MRNPLAPLFLALVTLSRCAVAQIRINAGGNSYLDTLGLQWQADNYFTGGKPYLITNPISGTADDVLYQTERWFDSDFSYSIPVSNGQWTVKLHFAETYKEVQSPGKRLFSVAIQGNTVLQNYDLFAKAGADAAWVETFATTVSGGVLNVNFIKGTIQNPKICAIEVLPDNMPAPSPVSTSSYSLYINAGAKSNYLDTQNRVWVADTIADPRFSFNTGKTYGPVVADIAGTSDDPLFTTERWDPDEVSTEIIMKYDIPVPNGSYQVELFFAEVWVQRPGERVFNVLVEGDTVLPNYDIIVAAGGFQTAVIESVSTSVTDGVLSVEFTRVTENPKICAIGIKASGSSPAGPYPAPAPTPSSPTSSSFTPIFLNAGGTDYYDGVNQWVADTTVSPRFVFNTGKAYGPVKLDILGTTNDQLFNTERWDPPDSSEMKYDFTVPNGSYEVNLYFAEVWVKLPGERLFNVLVEGVNVLPRYDILAAAGAVNTAVIETISTTVSDGVLSVLFEHITENPKVCAISVQAKESSPLGSGPTPAPTPANPTSPSFTPLFVNAGGTDYFDGVNQWKADTSASFGTPPIFNTGKAYGPVKLDILGTTNDQLFNTERWDPPDSPEMKYEFTVPNGTYEVKLYFTEVWVKLPGERLFNVLVEGVNVLPRYDILAAAGAVNTAVIETISTTVSDGKLSILFEHVVENPKICAISVASIVSGPPGPKPTPAPTSGTTSPPAPTPGATSPPAPTPKATSPPAPTAFSPILINAGGGQYTDGSGQIWKADTYFNSGDSKTYYKAGQAISGTSDPELYRSERYDLDGFPNLIYDIEVPDGIFQVRLHFADIYSGTHGNGKRVFDIFIEDSLKFDNVDIYREVGAYAALIKEETISVYDGSLTIEFKHVAGDPKLSAIEVRSVGTVKPHFAHAVPGGPYYNTDTQDNGFATIFVDGSFSHTHKEGASLVSWTWRIGGSVVGVGETTQFDVPVGDYELALEVVDSTNDVSEDVTMVNVRVFGFPYVGFLSPEKGPMEGGNKIKITGSAFVAPLSVNWGSTVLSGPQIAIISENEIEVLSIPTAATWGTVFVTVTTGKGTSDPYAYEYLPNVDLNFQYGLIADVYGVTRVAWGPDGKLYAATQGGDIIRFELNEKYQIVSQKSSGAVSASEPPYRTILGMAFDPTDTKEFPTIYVSHCRLFHGEYDDLDLTVNGKVAAVDGEDMNVVKNIITGLPVSDHDHGVNGIEFDNDGNMYIQVGGNTNAGVKGALSSTSLQDEEMLSAATLIARDVLNPNFDGIVRYDNPLRRQQVSGDVEVFAAGLRNSFGIVYHSNGRLYATDNGPNLKFGLKSQACNTNGNEPAHKDKLLLLEEGKYYGHANRMRGLNGNPRECIWRDPMEPSDTDYTAPIKMLESSSNGIIEWQTNHFEGMLRGDLIVARWKGQLYNVKLANEGKTTVGVFTKSPPVLIEKGGLDVTQGPDGSLFVAGNFNGNVFYHAPVEDPATKLSVKSTFPRRGPQAGGTELTVYGEKLFVNGQQPSVVVGNENCPVQATKTYTDVTGKTMQWVKCTLPPGTGTADVVVAFGRESYTFLGGYRYISGGSSSPGSGQPAVTPSPTPVPTPPPTPNPPPSGPSPSGPLDISDIVLVDAASDADITSIVSGSCNGCVTASSSVSARAVTFGSAASVQLNITGPLSYFHTQTEGIAPYALFGDIASNYIGRNLPFGTYEITARAFSGPGATGTSGTVKSASFYVSPSRRLRSVPTPPDQLVNATLVQESISLQRPTAAATSGLRSNS